MTGAVPVDGRALRLYVDPSGRDGVEFPTAVGPIDILARDDTGAFVVFELKRARSPDHAIGQLARYMGWVNYYGRFYKSELYPLLRRINDYLVRWAKRKFKRLRGSYPRARQWLVRVARREPTLFAQWRSGVWPEGWTMGAG